MNTDIGISQARTDELLITLDDAAKRLGLSRYRLQQLFSSGEIAQPVAISGCVRVLAKEVESYLRRLRRDESRRRNASMADAMAWMARTQAEEAAMAANLGRRFSPGDPNRLP